MKQKIRRNQKLPTFTRHSEDRSGLRPTRGFRPLRFVTVPFRLRAITLALFAAAAGVFALVIALTPPKQPNFLVPRSASPESPWPDGFVEFDASEWGSAERLGAPPSATRSGSASPAGSSSTRVVLPK